MKCRDCAATEYQPSRSRADVCASCYEQRLLLVRAMDQHTVDVETFQKIQRAMHGRSGRAAAMIRAALKQV